MGRKALQVLSCHSIPPDVNETIHVLSANLIRPAQVLLVRKKRAAQEQHGQSRCLSGGGSPKNSYSKPTHHSEVLGIDERGTTNSAVTTLSDTVGYPSDTRRSRFVGECRSRSFPLCRMLCDSTVACRSLQLMLGQHEPRAKTTLERVMIHVLLLAEYKNRSGANLITSLSGYESYRDGYPANYYCSKCPGYAAQSNAPCYKARYNRWQAFRVDYETDVRYSHLHHDERFCVVRQTRCWDIRAFVNPEPECRYTTPVRLCSENFYDGPVRTLRACSSLTYAQNDPDVLPLIQSRSAAETGAMCETASLAVGTFYERFLSNLW